MLQENGSTGAGNTTPSLTNPVYVETTMAKLSIAEKAIFDNRTCEVCGAPLVRVQGEATARWRVRRFCGVQCSGRGKHRAITPLADRFWAKVDKSPGQGPDGDCWQWTGSLNGRYGKIGVAGQGHGATELAHRISYRLATGDEAEGLCVLHRCDNPLCVRPGHLFLGSHADNTADMVAKGRDKGGFKRRR